MSEAGRKGVTRVDDFWFSNETTAVLKAGTKEFRVPKSTLAARSAVFRDMIASPQPEDGETEVIDGSPVILLDDEAWEVSVFLQAIFDSSFFVAEPADAALYDILGILRLAHKYDVQYLYIRALEVTEVRALWLLPLLYYETAIFAIELDMITDLTPEVRTSFAAGAYLVRATSKIYSIFARESALCVESQRCSALRVGCLKEYFELIEKNYNLDLSPLEKFRDGPRRNQIIAESCGPCGVQLKAGRAHVLQEVWDSLPSMFGLPPWPELLKNTP
ncbi:hypothetical protein DFH07DRAFT_774091 [Mycena maculata]|uniref:BTB domain-containing protein n=1 Tax=Mycena maculata TaxID=230809 RepID=A0AAD7NB36_9AGAR|nr:hypothetical protein DFH07DRAFT_774091 [Mycena maculata]